MIISHDDDKGTVTFSVCMGGISCGEKFRRRMKCTDCRQYTTVKWNWIDYISKKHMLGDWVEL
jgi:hypothetical protein